MSLRTLEQQRAGQAWNCVSEVKNRDFEGRYSALARSFPALVLTNGLGQALAFLRAKKKSHHKVYYEHVSHWTTKQIYGLAQGDENLLERLIGAESGCQSNSTTYRRATSEALSFMSWLKRFAEAELKKPEDDR